MDNPAFINDLLFWFSAIGSSIVGVACGWQLRSSRLALTADRLDRHSVDGVDGDVVTTSSIAANSNDTANTLGMSVVGSAADTSSGSPSFIDHAAPLSNVYGEVPQELSQTEIREVAQRLLKMAEGITADVAAHDAQLSEVNHSLNRSDEMPTMDFVLAAVEQLVAANETMQSQLRESRDQIVVQAMQIETAEQRANTDALTRVANRRAFDHALGTWNGETPGVLALLDIDHFKRFNDEHGHRAGDEVLRTVAALLSSQLDGECLVARYGGEEFALVYTDRRLETVIDKIETARRSIAEHKTMFDGKVFRVTCSLGVTRMVAGESSIEWVQRADEGLYLSKDAGRNCGHCIDSQIIGKREKPFRLGTNIDGVSFPTNATKVQADASIARQSINQLALQRIESVASLSESYRELLQRVGKMPISFSIISISISNPEKPIPSRLNKGTVTRLSQLIDVAQGFCRPLDRVGWIDEKTLVVCCPGLEYAAVIEHARTLHEIVASQVQIPGNEMTIGYASAKVGVTFEQMIERALQAIRM